MTVREKLVHYLLWLARHLSTIKNFEAKLGVMNRFINHQERVRTEKEEKQFDKRV